ncbi:sulfotransferase 1C2-like [Ornithodoros turicata]|uniref:sulfotransferase 1C2-like n=1 Tax=Ornithodoros turicata TaxID=34597 RepID=UPI00313930B2
MATRRRPTYVEIEGLRLTADYRPEFVQEALRFIPEPGDIFLVTYPKCGTHWLSQIIQLILHKGESADNFFQALSWSRIPEFLGTDVLEDAPRPRFMKTHLPFTRLNFSNVAKYVYVTRNPWDCCVSFYHHTKTFPAYHCEDVSFDDYFEMFIKGETDHGDYFDHLLSTYALKNESNVFFLTYEDLKKDTKKWVLRLAGFLGDEYARALRDENVLGQVLEKSTVSYMKTVYEMSESNLTRAFAQEELPEVIRKICGQVLTWKGDGARLGFVRKGEVGGCKAYFKPDQWQRLWEKLNDRLGHTDLMNLWDWDSLRCNAVANGTANSLDK